MTITILLNPEEEVKLIALAEGRGVSPDALVKSVVKTSSREALLLPPRMERSHLKSGRGGFEKLFESFDSTNVPTTVSEEAFHREN